MLLWVTPDDFEKLKREGVLTKPDKLFGGGIDVGRIVGTVIRVSNGLDDVAAEVTEFIPLKPRPPVGVQLAEVFSALKQGEEMPSSDFKARITLRMINEEITPDCRLRQRGKQDMTLQEFLEELRRLKAAGYRPFIQSGMISLHAPDATPRGPGLTLDPIEAVYHYMTGGLIGSHVDVKAERLGLTAEDRQYIKDSASRMRPNALARHFSFVVRAQLCAALGLTNEADVATQWTEKGGNP